MSTAPTDALELLREIYADLVQGAIPNADDPWWQKASAALAGTTTQAQAGAVPLTVEQIQDLLLCGNPTDEEMRLIRIGWDAAHGIKGGQHGTE